MADDGSQFPRIPIPLRDWRELNRRTSELSINVLSRIEAMDEAVGDPDTATEIRGTPIALGGLVLVEVETPITEEHYVLLTPSVQGSDGRWWSALTLGPRYVPTLEDRFEDPADYDLDTPAVVLAGSTLTQAFADGDTTLAYGITLTEESSNRTSVITVEVWYNIAAVGGGWTQLNAEDFAMSSNSRIDVDRTYPVTQAGLAAGDQFELRVSAVKGHQQATPWVRGSQRTSYIEVRQG